jgi:hypothetical protein
MILIGIDNGVSGQIGVVYPNGDTILYHTPVMKLLHYTKAKQFFTRIDTPALETIFTTILSRNEVLNNNLESAFILLERPMVNPMRFKATESALRSYEATLIVIERLKIGHRVIDSKEWQKKMLPEGLKGKELKKASLDVGKRTFPKIDFTGFDDADGLLLAWYGRTIMERNNLNEK